jgi:polar amino acid transport system substrate-binding protein
MRRLACAAALMLVVVVIGSQSKALPDLKGRSIRAVAANLYAPLSFTDPATNKGAGLEYDLVNEIGRRLNARIAWSAAPWNALLQSVHEGRYDVGASGITITEDRKELVDFSDPYLVSQQLMLVRADEARFSSAKELAADAKLLIGAQTGAASFYAAAYNMLDGDEHSPRIKLFASIPLAVKALLGGDVDCVLAEAAAARGFAAANPGKLKLVGEALARESIGLVFTPGSDLTSAFNAAIKSMKDDGTLDRLATKWFYRYAGP